MGGVNGAAALANAAIDAKVQTLGAAADLAVEATSGFANRVGQLAGAGLNAAAVVAEPLRAVSPLNLALRVRDPPWAAAAAAVHVTVTVTVTATSERCSQHQGSAPGRSCAAPS